LVLAVFLSSLAGLVADSLLFLWLAFDDFSFLGGQVIGKLWMVMLSLPLIALLRRRDEKIGLLPV
jgi:queuosine precursor transporter